MTIPYITTVRFYSMPFKASKEKISTLLRQKTEEATKAIDNLAQPTFRRSKAFLAKAAEISIIGFAGIFAGVFCIFFPLIYTIIYYKNKRK